MTVDVVFETSFEICNKVGGIHTVISSKASFASHAFSEYILIGPTFPGKVSQELVEEKDAPAHWKAPLARLASRGIKTIVGRWLIPGEPRVILIDFSAAFSQKDDFKRQLWEKFGVDSLHAGFDFDEPLAFSLAAGMLIQEFAYDANPAFSGKRIISQTHEWMTGFANLYLKLQHVPVKTVFTTHATMLGRAIAGAGIDVYQAIKKIDPYEAAKTHGVIEKFTAERACAQQADIFTTVSDLTAIEAKALLGREPDVITQNGLPMQQFPSFEQASIIHAQSKAAINEFYRYYFFPYHKLDVENSLSFFVSGRYEFRNKGMDITIKALGKLNEQLIKEESKRTVVTLFLVPMQQWGVKKDLLESKLFYKSINQLLTVSEKQMHDALLTNELERPDSSPPPSVAAVTPVFTQELRRLVKLFNKPSSIAPFCTHMIGNEADNEIIRAFMAAGLQNRPLDRVKVMLYPIYLDGADSLLDLTYYDAINGCHLGLFASFYEPWGYTPMECAALGVPAVTTTSAGFGQFVVENSKNTREGIFVLDRLHKSDGDILNEYARILSDYVKLTHHERVKHKIAAKLLAEKADWAFLYEAYKHAYELAAAK